VGDAQALGLVKQFKAHDNKQVRLAVATFLLKYVRVRHDTTNDTTHTHAQHGTHGGGVQQLCESVGVRQGGIRRGAPTHPGDYHFGMKCTARTALHATQRNS
jgi:hypothetical protein